MIRYSTRFSRGGVWLVPLLLALLVGCQGAIRGDWHLVEAKPNRHTFSIDNATFGRDGTYAARTTIEGQTHDETGTYEYTAFKLRLLPKGGGVRTYTTNVSLGRLELTDGKRQVVLEKGKKGG